MLRPTVRRTWAPAGQTPICRCWDRRDRLSAISAITVSPKRHRLDLCFRIMGHNVRTEDFERFGVALLRRPGSLILVLDRYQVHRSAAKRLLRRFPRRLSVEWLPAYAPDLNPAEQVWNRAKYTDLPNFVPDDTRELHRAVRRSFKKTASQHRLLKSFFKHAGLTL